MEQSRELLIQTNEIHSLYLQLSYNYWLQHSLYSWKWWLLLFLLVIPWYFWWRMVDKRRLLEILCYGLMTFILVMATDASGVAHGYWFYPIRLGPKFPHILPVDTTVLPIVYMLVYQNYPKWKDFMIAATVMAAALAFIGEPLVVWLGYYEPIAWKYYYSFPIYILIAAILKFIVQTATAIQAGSER